jgi:hypothetical protein
MANLIKTQTNFLIAVKIGSKWKKVGIISYIGKRFDSCDYELPDDIWHAIDKACRRCLDTNVGDLSFELSMYPDCEFRVTAYV